MPTDTKSTKSGFLDESKVSKPQREIVIRINPRRAMKVGAALLVLLSVFYLGRFSVDPPSLTGFSIFDEKSEKEVVKDPVVKKAATVQAASSTKKDAIPEAEPEGVTEEVAAEATEYATKYGKQVLAIDEVKTTWLGTWGKITDLTYTLKNDDSLPVKVSYLKLMVEGYDDYEKKVPVPVSLQVVSGSSKKQVTVKVPQGFAYNPTTAGDLKSVTVTIALYDAADGGISTATQNVALKSS